jgi:hypothetical protein
MNTTVTFMPLTGSAVVMPMPDDIDRANEAITFTWRDPIGQSQTFRQLLDALKTFEARRISGGQPRRNLSGYRDAVADPGAQICTVTWQEIDPWTGSSIDYSETGIISIVSVRVARREESISVILYPCDRLRFYGMTTFQELPPEEEPQ